MGPVHAPRRAASVLLTFVALAVAVPVAAGPELRRISGHADAVTVLSETRIPVSDDGGHVIVLARHLSVEKWNIAGCETMRVTSVSVSDLTGRTGSSRGYRVATCPDGDTLSFTYEGTLDVLRDASGRATTMFGGHWQSRSGTGKFHGMTGGGTYSGRTTPERTVIEWEGEQVVSR